LNGLKSKFGKHRCFSTPLSEAALTGIAIGAAQRGLKPILVHNRVDFALLGMNQLINMATNFSYLSGGTQRVPLVIIAHIGRSWGQGPQHSKSMHAMFAHFPGLRVVMPASPQDAFSLLITAIEDPNPVVYLTHRWFHRVRGPVDDELRVPLGRAKVERSGVDVSIIATTCMVIEALHAAEILSRHGVEAEVVDVRTVVPLDIETIAESVRKTRRVVIADYDWKFCGVSAEVAAEITQHCWGSLAAPPERVGFAPTPCPTTRPLEDLFYPNAKDVVRGVEKLLDIPEIDLSGENFNTYERLFEGLFKGPF
jgi:pyruvate dehydrogenase E1 component beta subunit